MPEEAAQRHFCIRGRTLCKAVIEEDSQISIHSIFCFSKKNEQEITSTPETDFSESYKDYEEGPHSIKLREEVA